MKEHYFVLLSTQKENKLTFARKKVEVDVYFCASYFSQSPSKQLAGARVAGPGMKVPHLDAKLLPEFCTEDLECNKIS